MQDALQALAVRTPQLKRGFLLMMDFDGVLAPIAARPESARMSSRTRALVRSCARRGQIAVISGRALSDVRKRVGLKGIWYAGNHGNEWRMGKERGHENLPLAARVALCSAWKAFTALSRRYSGVVPENKYLTFSVHFRHLPRRDIAAFRQEVRRITRAYSRTLAIAEGNEHIVNVRAISGRTKGSAVRLARTLVPKRFMPIYIGDDTTDEDAFKVLIRGMTIRVGKRRGSAARYFVRSRKDVDTILAMFARRR